MKISINQPTYLPWLGYFEQINFSDVFVFLDSVQFAKSSWQCRNRLRNKDGSMFFLTVPVNKCSLSTPISGVSVADDNGKWKLRHLNSIKASLGKGPFFPPIYEVLEGIYAEPYNGLADLNIRLIQKLSEYMGLKIPKFMRSSDLNVSGKRSELLANICQAVGANYYYSSLGSAAYIEDERDIFTNMGIEIEYQNFLHPHYEQCGGGFTSHSSVIDALANIGPDGTRELIQKAHEV